MSTPTTPHESYQLRLEPLDNFGRFNDYLSAASRRLLAKKGTNPVLEQYRVAGFEDWWDMPTKPGMHWPKGLDVERRAVLCAYLGFVITGPIQPYHLSHFAGCLNQAVARGLLSEGCLVAPFAMQLAYGRHQVGPGRYDDFPLRYVLAVYAYTTDMAAVMALDWSFNECDMPPDFPEHLYATPLLSDREPSTPAPRGYWGRHATRAVEWALFAASALYTGWNLAVACCQ